MKKKSGRRVVKFFTLLEMVISLAILSLIASVCGFGMQNMVADYQYQKGSSLLLSELKKSHLIALANQTDLELRLWKEGERVFYQFRSDDPIACFISKPYTLSQITKIYEGKKEITSLSVPLYSTGRVGDGPLQISFFKKNGKGFILDLQTPHLFKIIPRSFDAHNKS